MKCCRLMAIAGLCLLMNSAHAQDPAFSQFFSSPLNVNPALTANINGDWRAIMHFRHQWSGPSLPYVTGTISFDSKVAQHKVAQMPEQPNIWGIGAYLMYDRTMGGAVRSTYASLAGSYSVRLSEGDYTQRVTLGFSGSYGRRYIDFSRLDFEDQWVGTGFDLNLPTGEAYLENMKPYVSLNTGITYSIKSDHSNFDIGAAAYHLNAPKQTFLKNENQTIPIRKVAHVNYETLLNDYLLLSTNAIYQFQDDANYLSVGGAVGYFLNDNTVLNAGLWYWSKNAVVPYVGFGLGQMQVGVTYDVTMSKLRSASPRASTWELAIIYRGVREPTKLIYCPWK
ncbi:MAG: type IX secretion system membrane protein PorP/SprF [Sphingobacteriales bacterium]|nr:MAG: type IX secretion system membrane protein PorP/SprF [Sphingobacteriales bacterium]